MSIHCHPEDELLVAYAAGSLDEATALLIATHATLCPHCRDAISGVEAVGGEVLESLPPDVLDDTAFDAVLERLSRAPLQQTAKPPVAEGLPVPLHYYVDQQRGRIAWRWLGPGIRQSPLLQHGAARIRMLKISPERIIPHHRHGGIEYTLVLDGAYSDENGQYGVGDFMVADAECGHQPVAASQGCVCLVMSIAPMRLTSRFGRLFNSFLPY